MSEFECKVINHGEDENGLFVVLDKDIFYPDGKGGQIGDRGMVDGEKILFVKECCDEVRVYLLHLPESHLVKCVRDEDRRHTISALHTAQHILSAVLEDKFSVVTKGFHMSEENCTIDLTPASVSKETLDKAEMLANEVVFRNLPVKKYFVTKEEASKLHLRKRAQVESKIRIVEIPGVDVSMCGGTHVDFTGEVGLIKILKTEKVKKEFLRVYFSAEKRTLFAFKEKADILFSISQMLSSGEMELPQKIEKMLSEIKSLKKENKQFKIAFLKNFVSELVSSGDKFLEKEFDSNKGDFMSVLAMLSSENTDKIFLIYSKKNLLLGVAKGKANKNSLKDKFADFTVKSGVKGIVKDNFLFLEFERKEDFIKILESMREAFRN
jgi:alanyl-tRNA synthetase